MSFESRPFAYLAERLVRHRRLKPGRELFHEGDAFDGKAYLIVSGQLHVLVEALDGTALLLYRLGPGELVGELCFFGEPCRTATVVATETTELVEIGTADWRAIVEDPEFDRRTAAHFYHRYVETHHVVKRLGQAKVIHRLMIYLLGMTEWARADEGCLEVRLPPHRELAQLIRCTRERVTVLLGELARAGVIERIDRHHWRLYRERMIEHIRRL
ncbi:MAG: Crp/Fnr family transcriptional regulator [Mariprofundaceae bacterium]